MAKLTQRIRKAIAAFSAKSLDYPSGVEIETNANGTPVAFFVPLSYGGNNIATKTPQELVYAYNRCAPVASIINKKVKAHLNRRIEVVDVDGEVVTNSTAKTVKALLARPNPVQDGRRFEAQAKAYIQLFGECFILAPRAIESRADSVRQMWVVPNWYIKPVMTGKLYQQTDVSGIIQKYELSINGERSDIAITDVIHIKDIQVNSDNFILGSSRLTSLSDPVNTIIAAYEANNELIVNHGAMGIISPPAAADVTGKALPWVPKEKDDIQAAFSRYGIGKGKLKYIIANAALQFQPIAMPIKDLLLMESISESIRQIAESYDVPKCLLGFDKGTTYSNLQEAKKSLYQDAIIPEADDYYATITSHLQLDKSSMFIRAYYDHLEIFQHSKLEEANALKAYAEALNAQITGGYMTTDEAKAAIQTFTT